MSRKSIKARELRRDPSRAEKLCWELIRAHRMEGIKFRRQYPLGPYFADIACVSKKLVIEIDGDHHAPARRSRMRGQLRGRERKVDPHLAAAVGCALDAGHARTDLVPPV